MGYQLASLGARLVKQLRLCAGGSERPCFLDILRLRTCNLRLTRAGVPDPGRHRVAIGKIT